MKIRGDTYEKGGTLGDAGRSPRKAKAIRVRTHPTNLSEAEKTAFLALAGPPMFTDLLTGAAWTPPRVNWGKDETRENLLRDFIEDEELLRLDGQARTKVLEILTTSRFHAWGIDGDATLIERERLHLATLKKAPGFRLAFQAFRAVLRLFGEPPFPVSPGIRWQGYRLTEHDDMIGHAWGFLDSTMRNFPAIGLEFPDFYPKRLRHGSTVPKGKAMISMRKGLRHFGFSRENVSRMLYVVRLVPKLTGNV